MRKGARIQPTRHVRVYHSRWSKTTPGREPSGEVRFGGRHFSQTRKAGDERLNIILESNANQVGPRWAKERLGRKKVEKYTLDTKKMHRAKNPIIETTGFSEYKILEVVGSPQRKELVAKGYKGVAYQNMVEDPGSVSYLVWDESALKRRHRKK